MRKAFTLIELLIVIAIIGILAGILFVSIGQNPLIKSRDAKRVSDLQNLRTALTLYYTDNNAYPATLATMSPTYIPAVPIDPKNATATPAASATTCHDTTGVSVAYNGGNYGYVYNVGGAGGNTAYALHACLEAGNTVLNSDCDDNALTPACTADSGSANPGVFDIHS